MQYRFLFFAFMAVFCACAQVNVKGLYHSDDCGDFSENCFQYRFHDDGNFSYWYTNATFGDFYVSGNYYVIGKRLKLFPVRYIYYDTTHIEYSDRASADSLTVRISMLPGHFKNMPDTMQMPWLIRVNNEQFFSDTDDYGAYTFAADSVYKVDIKEYSAKFYMDSELPEADTSIVPLFRDRDLHIYLASRSLEPIVIPPVSVFRIHKNGAYLESLDSMDLGYWRHTTRGYVR